MRFVLIAAWAILGLLTACDDASETDRHADGGASAGGSAGAPLGGASAGGGVTGTAGTGGAIATNGGAGPGGAGVGGAGASGVILPDFTLVDINPASPTFQEARSLSDAAGKVLMLYMAQFT